MLVFHALLLCSEVVRQHAARQPDAVVAASVPIEVFRAAALGELREVVKWLGKPGKRVPIDALIPVLADGNNGQTAAVALLHTAAAHGHLEVVRVLLKRGASVDLQSNLGGTALMGAASYGRLSTLLLLLQHSANPDLQDKFGINALMMAAHAGQEACVEALLQAKADTELLDARGRTALHWATAGSLAHKHTAVGNHAAVVQLLRQHAAPAPQPPAAASHAEPADAGYPASPLPTKIHTGHSAPRDRLWMMPWVVLGAIALGAFLTVGLGMHRAAQQRRPQPIRQREAPPQPAGATAPHAVLKAKQAARADAATEEVLAEERTAEQAKGRARLRKSKRKTKAGRPTAPEDGGIASLVTVPQEEEGGVAAGERYVGEDKLEMWRQEAAEREARQEAAAEAARLTEAERVQEAAALEAVQVAAAADAREQAVAAATATAKGEEEAAAAAAIVDALEQVVAVGSADGSINGAASPSAARKAVEVPHDYLCSITSEIMTDPVCTSDGFTYEREAITEWLRTNDTSPLTGAKLESKVLVPNLIFRSTIRRFVEAQGQASMSL